MTNFKFRELTADEIELRVGSVSENGATLLLYKNARVDMDILDETVGANYWGRDHKDLKGVMYCGVSIYDDELKQWVTKYDAGAESRESSEKGEASDSFKRACVNWGIGRELYTAPMIFISCETVPDGKYWKLKNKYFFNNHSVSRIQCKEGSITALTIKDSKKVVWDMGKYVEPEEIKPKTISDARAKSIQAYCLGSGITVDDYLTKYNAKEITDLTDAQADELAKTLKGAVKK